MRVPAYGWALPASLSLLLASVPFHEPTNAAGKVMPIGTANGMQIACAPGGLQASACYRLNISCPEEGIAPIVASLKVIAPAGVPIGTVTFASGGGGGGYYETAFNYGPTAISNVVAAGFMGVEIAFNRNSNGWLQGPGGPLNLSCRYATANEWIYTHLHQGGATAPLCPTANSGGAGAISYALAHYGMGAVFSMVEVTSGPVFSRVDYGCICDQPNQPTPCGEGLLNLCYGIGNATEFLDPAYQNTWCSTDVQTHSHVHQMRYYSDSIDSSTAVYSYPTTDVHVVFGGMDYTSAVPQGNGWVTLITTKKTVDCVADAGHSLPDSLDGAQKVANDLIDYCRIQ
jgi:hypothetical protein